MSTVVVLELFKTEASQINLCVAKCWAHCWNHFENKHILVISEGVLFISEMQCVVLTIVLAITRWSKHYSIWDAYCWWNCWHLSVVVYCGSNLNCTEPNFRVAYVRMSKSSAANLRLGVSSYGAYLWIERRSYFKLGVIVKPHHRVGGFLCIKGNLYIHIHPLSFEWFLIFRKFGRATLNGRAVYDSCVHECSVKNAFSLSEAPHVNKILALYGYLSVAIGRSTLGVDAKYLRSFIVEKADGFRLGVSTISVICYC